MPYKILFVCTGNICRSPLAEAVLRNKIEKLGLGEQYHVDSAGTHNYHVGERPDPRTLRIAEINGVSTDGIIARQVSQNDFKEFDLILGMDSGHVKLLKESCSPEFHPKIQLFMDYAGGGKRDVPDPYYGDFSGFKHIFQLIDQYSENLI